MRGGHAERTVSVMHIHLAAYELGADSWNGHSQMLRFLVAGLQAAGHTITATGSEPRGAQNRYVFSRYNASSGWEELSALDAASTDSQLWNDSVVSWAAALLRDHRTDAVYAQGGGPILDVVQAGADTGRRVVYHVHDYDLLCSRRFLFDHKQRPCTGPESVSKCWNCVRRRYSWRAQAASSALRISGVHQRLPRALKARLRRYAFHEHIARDLARSRAAASVVDCFIATGQPVADVLQRFGIYEAKIARLPHVVTRPELAAEPTRSVRTPGPVRIAYFGRLSPEKGVDMLARVLAKIVAEQLFRFEWRVICDGSENVIRSLLHDHRLPDLAVTHVQPKDATAIVAALRMADIAVFPSPWPEIGPLALLECLRQGVVCVASDSMAMASMIVEGVSGYLFPANDEPRLLEALRTATAHPVVRGDAERQPFLEAPDHQEYFSRLTRILAGVDNRPKGRPG